MKRTRRKRNRRRGRSFVDGMRLASRGLLVLLLAGSGVAAVTVVARWVHDHPYFALRSLDVVGASDPARVRRWTGLRPGTSLWSVDPGTIEQDLLRHGRIHEVSVIRELPDRIRVLVRERQPVGLFRPDDPLFVAEDGILFAPFPGEAIEGLPWISGLGIGDLEERPGWALEKLRRAAAVIRGWERHPGWPRISEVRPEGDGEVVVYPERIRLAVRFGEPIADDAFGRLEAVFRRWRGSETNVAAIDLTVPGQAVLRMRKSSRVMGDRAAGRQQRI